MNSTFSKCWATPDETREALAGNSLYTLLSRRLEHKTAKIGVIGLGHAGLPLALRFARKGFHTTGFEIDSHKIEMLWRGESYLEHIAPQTIVAQITRNTFVPRADFANLAEMDAVVICVPAPLDAHQEPNFSFVKDAGVEIVKHLRHGQLIVLENTTYPHEILHSILEESGLNSPPAPYITDSQTVTWADVQEPDFFLAFSPELEGHENQSLAHDEIPKTIGGVNGPSALAAQALYECIFEQTFIVSPSHTAEVARLLENIYRCVNIPHAHEMR